MYCVLDNRKKYYQLKRERLSRMISTALLDMAILQLQEEDKPIDDQVVNELVEEYVSAMSAVAVGSCSAFVKGVTAAVEADLKSKG